MIDMIETQQVKEQRSLEADDGSMEYCKIDSNFIVTLSFCRVDFICYNLIFQGT